MVISDVINDGEDIDMIKKEFLPKYRQLVNKDLLYVNISLNKPTG